MFGPGAYSPGSRGTLGAGHRWRCAGLESDPPAVDSWGVLGPAGRAGGSVGGPARSHRAAPARGRRAAPRPPACAPTGRPTERPGPRALPAGSPLTRPRHRVTGAAVPNSVRFSVMILVGWSGRRSTTPQLGADHLADVEHDHQHGVEAGPGIPAAHTVRSCPDVLTSVPAREAGPSDHSRAWRAAVSRRSASSMSRRTWARSRTSPVTVDSAAWRTRAERLMPAALAAAVS